MTDSKQHSTAPPPNDDHALGRVIRTFVRTMIPMMLVWGTGFAMYVPRLALRTLAFSAAFIGLGVISMRLVAANRARLASIIMSTSAWCVVAVWSYSDGGVRSPAYFAFTAMVLMTGVLWSSRAAYVMTACSTALGAYYVWLQSHGALPDEPVSRTAMMTWIAASLVFGTVATLQYLSARAARESLARAREESVQRKLAEQESIESARALEASERRYRHIFESAAVALFEMELSQLIEWRKAWSAAHPDKVLLEEIETDRALVDEIGARTHILDVNDEGLRMLELQDKQQLLGSLTPRMRGTARRSAVQVALALTDDTEQTPRVVQRELSVSTFHGRRRILLVTGRAPAPPARRDRLVVSAVDLTEARLREERARTVQRLEAIGRLAGGVAHDFNNALMVINSWANMLSKPGRTEAERAEGLNAISTSAARAGEVVRRLLSMGRHEPGEPKATNLSAVIDETVRSIERLLPEDIEISVHLGFQGQVMADEAQLQQVLVNLALNARDAMPQGGKLELRTRLCGPGEASDIGGDQPTVEISVRDTGLGMDRATQQRIFEPFFSTKTEGRGTGLGLSSAQAVIAQAGGKIDVESARGRGTCLRIFLPSVESVWTAPSAPMAKALDGRGRTILVVEDEELVRSVLVETLLSAGYHVLEAGDGAAALALANAQQIPIDLLCTDGILPGMATRQMIDEFKKLFPSAPVLVCSGHVQEELMRRSISSGEFAFLPKPFPPESLVGRVEELLRGSMI